jgi:hypothetical protein
VKRHHPILGISTPSKKKIFVTVVEIKKRGEIKEGKIIKI